MKTQLTSLEKKIGISFRDKGLLKRALTHSSFAYEQQPPTLPDNEVLEFLGDSVVGLVTADFFCSAFPGSAEGDLSKFKSAAASTLSLSQLARKIRLDRYLLLGKGEERSGGRMKKTILADGFEALVGAIYLDQGYEPARQFLLPFLRESYKETDSQKFLINNFKSALQEHFQKESLPAPEYKTVTSIGPDHRKTFIVEVYLGPYPLAKAKGLSKKSAEQLAAKKALRSLLGKKMKVISPETFMIKK
jgi:ribonuclease-3